MNGREIGIVYRKELRDSLRDRRTIISMIVVPVLVIPLMTFGIGALMFKVMTRAKQEIPRVMIVGGENSPKVLATLRAAGNIQIVPESGNFTNELREKRIRAVVKLPADFDSAIAGGEKAGVEIFENQGDVNSSFAAEKMNTFFRNLSDMTVRERLETRNVSADVLTPFTIQRQNLAPPAQVTGALVGGMITYLMLMMCMMGAMHPAIDLTTGEKERGTIETILCAPVERINLVLGKFLMVLTASVGTVFLSLLSTEATVQVAKHVLANSVPQAALQMATTMDIGGMAGAFVILMPAAAMFSAVLLMLGLFSRSFREAQSYAGPMMLVMAMPTVFAILPGMEMNARFAVLPVVNVGFACKEMMAGFWHWDLLLLTFGSTCVYALAALAAAVWLFHRESVVFRS